MKVTKHYCDKCKKETDSNLLREFVIGLRNWGCRNYLGVDKSYELCKACCEKMGMVERVVEGDKVVTRDLDIKDRLYSLAVELYEEIGRETMEG